MDELDSIATQLKERGIRKVERIDAPDGSWSYLRRRMSPRHAFVVYVEPSGSYLVQSVRADAGPAHRSTGLTAQAAVEAFAHLVSTRSGRSTPAQEEIHLSGEQAAQLVAGLWNADGNQTVADYVMAAGAPWPVHNIKLCDGCDWSNQPHWHGEPAPA